MKTWISAAAVALAGGLVLASTAPVSAATRPVLKRVAANGPWTKQPVQTVTAKCPSGYRVISGGVATSTSGRDYVTQAQPVHTNSGDGYTVTARSLQTGVNWAAHAVAVCAKGLSGVRIVSAVKYTDGSKVTATARCGSGTRVFGFGGKVTGTSEAQVDGVGSASSGRAGYAEAVVVSEDSVPPYAITSYAVCAKPVSGWRVLTKTRSNQATGAGGGVASSEFPCPSGTRLYGAASDVLDGKGAVRASFQPNPQLNRVWATGWADSDVYDGSYLWSIKATAVCAR